MIRFHCPNCDRPYLLPDALARLPLVCKGCGHHLHVPNPSPDPEPEPPPEAKVEPPPPAGAEIAAPVPPPPADPELTTDSPPTETTPAKPAAAPEPLPPAAAPAGRQALGLFVDVAVAVVLAAGGALLGELATRRPTGEVLRTAEPLDLLVWAGCVAFPLLVYVLLANRGKTVGGWLRRRAG